MTPDEVKQSITNWCSSDDDLEIASDRFEPGTDFSFGLKAGTLSTAPVDLVVLKADGADRVTVRRSVTLTGDNVDAANQLVSSRPGSVTAAVDRSGADTTVVAQTYVYLDGLSKHTFVQAVAELARTSTLLNAIGGSTGAGATRAAHLHPAARAGVPAAARAGAAGPAARRRGMGAEPLGAAAGAPRLGRPGPVRTRGRQPCPRAANSDRRSPRRMGARDLLQRVDRLDRRPHHRRRCLTFDVR
jgi:hypothetical protein